VPALIGPAAHKGAGRRICEQAGLARWGCRRPGLDVTNGNRQWCGSRGSSTTSCSVQSAASSTYDVHVAPTSNAEAESDSDDNGAHLAWRAGVDHDRASTIGH
jgi:hypothetical protein